MLERNTIVSKNVLLALKKSNHPLSAENIINQLAEKNLHPNKSTIYRILKKLTEKKLITNITIKNGITFYEFTSSNHNHFICDDCELIFCLNETSGSSNKINLASMLPNQNFKVTSHYLNIYGICEKCSKTT